MKLILSILISLNLSAQYGTIHLGNIGSHPVNLTIDDKFYHYYGSGFVSSSNCFGMYQLNDRIGLCCFYGMGVGMLVGTAKEIHDIHTTGFNGADLAVDFLGSAGGAMFTGIAFNIQDRNKRERRIYKSVKKQ